MTATAPRIPAAEPATTVPAARETAPAAVADPPPSTGQGRTAIADQVVGKIAGMAAREVDGVHSFGAGLTRALGAVRDRVPGGRSAGSVTRGVKVEVGEKQAAVDLDLVVEYGVSIAEVAADVREEVIGAVERMTGLQVVEVNVNVVDVHLPDEDEDTGEPDATRVR
ncbi:Asp23/Gls24 family envelope stress response protein [Kitasatospora cineracea]|uniref:Alkaline shock family protein YloU n=1 Tax=Kitasatospora cineracea TaxID=88074 RepID=A0A3N4RUV9_9ACTN|nr:Asp23/Gls24 family envelope stress response protein [Kitasatospora cineracea]ROR46957.1 putative alkaline shock family protein YloU [Kitasatospora cineracea]RPE37122.1 putative alkaline shock family protein YloU [Kitasatospora cineracea]